MNRKNYIIPIIIVALVLGCIVLWKMPRQATHRKPAAKKPRYETVQVGPRKQKTPATIVPGKVYQNPKVAIVMDDFGYNRNNLDALFAIGQPVTLSILPELRYSKEIAEEARSHGYEAILHLPLEPKNSKVGEEADTIKCGMLDKEVESRLVREIASVPGLKGVSNHMGSKATEDKRLMIAVFKVLKRYKLYFSDSLTSQKSVCREAAEEVGIPYARRDIFLDNNDNVESIERQLLIMKKMAFRKGVIIAVCHDKPKTITVLSKEMPEMAKSGIRFVKLSEMVK